MPRRDYARLKVWCGYRAALSWGRPAPDDQVEIATNIAAYRAYLRGLVVRPGPGGVRCGPAAPTSPVTDARGEERP